MKRSMQPQDQTMLRRLLDVHAKATSDLAHAVQTPGKRLTVSDVIAGEDARQRAMDARAGIVALCERVAK